MHSAHTPNAQHQPVLELREVTKSYSIGDQQINALNGVSVSINKGEFVAIMGPSGSGKSTFLQIASILAEPTSGVILLDNKDVSVLDEPKRAKVRNQNIGFVFQQFNLLPKTSAIENVALPLVYAGVPEKERQERAIELLNQVGLGERLKNTPAQLSGGQQQRVAIARALINNPSVIFADEPTGNLDTKSGEEILEILAKLHKQGKTIIMVTHEHDVAAIAGRLIDMRDGKIISDKPHRPGTEITIVANKVVKKQKQGGRS